MTSTDQPTGPENPRGADGPDAPAPPGGPQRSDAPAGSTSPGGPAQTADGPEPEAHADSSGAASPSGQGDETPGSPAPAAEMPDGSGTPRTQTEQANEQLQEENAETALDQPSDGSGGE